MKVCKTVLEYHEVDISWVKKFIKIAIHELTSDRREINEGRGSGRLKLEHLPVQYLQ